jgi:hypothetical protein
MWQLLLSHVAPCQQLYVVAGRKVSKQAAGTHIHSRAQARRVGVSEEFYK